MAKDFYLVLGVSRGADVSKIKKAYRQIAKEHHPDISRSKAGAEKLIEVREAYETLTDETRRRAYDAELARQSSSVRLTRVPDTVRVSSLPHDKMDHFTSFVDEFFEGFLPGFYTKERGRSAVKDLYYEVILTPEEARNGGLFPLSVPVIEGCPRCRRSGYWEGFVCPVCMGRGRVNGEREFSLSIPPNVRNGTEMTLSMEDIGLKNTLLHVALTIEPH